MKIVPLDDLCAIKLVIDEIHQRPVLIQFPTVFVLMAAPTEKGAAQLDKTKTRLTGKNYGTAIGSLEKFIAQANPEQLPPEFNCVQHYRPLAGTFIRLPFRHESFQSTTIRNGTHQGLLLSGSYSTLFKRIEASFEHSPPQRIWNNRNYCAPLCTSCNVSGDSEGSIVAYDKALMFARSRGIQLFITTSQPATEKGSYPILGFEKNKVRIHREGPGLNWFKDQIPASLRTW